MDQFLFMKKESVFFPYNKLPKEIVNEIITGLQAIGYHENDAKMPIYWIGTKKGLNDMEWLK